MDINEIGAKLTTKVGPLPVWAYGAIGAVGIFVLSRGGAKQQGGDFVAALPDGNRRDTGDYVDPFDISSLVSGYTGPGSYSTPIYNTGAGASDRAFAASDASGAQDGVNAGGDSPTAKGSPTPGLVSRFFPGIGNLFQNAQGYFSALSPTLDVDISKKAEPGKVAYLPVSMTVPNPAAQVKYDPISGGVSIPGTDKTQGLFVDDLVGISQRLIANDPSLQTKLANANVTPEQRNAAIVGPGGILTFANEATDKDTNVGSTGNTYNGIAVTPEIASYLGLAG